MDKLEVDENLNWTPCHPVQKSKLRYSDHYAMFLTFKNIPMKSEKIVKKEEPIIWNTNKPGGWKRYFSKTNENEVLDEATKSESENVNHLMKTITKEVTKIKHSCFGKVRVSKVSPELREIKSIQKEKLIVVNSNEDEFQKKSK